MSVFMSVEFECICMCICITKLLCFKIKVVKNPENCCSVVNVAHPTLFCPALEMNSSSVH
jgi:hypothetical protein